MEKHRRTENQKRKKHAIVEENKNKKKNNKLKRLKNKTRMKTIKAILPFWRARENLENSFERTRIKKTTIFRSCFPFFKISTYT